MIARTGCLLMMLMSTPTESTADDLLTVAEASDYTATSTSAQVLDLIDRIASRSPIMRVAELGRTVEDKPIPLLLLANSTVKSVDEAVRDSAAHSKPICFIMANIHAGEVEGKEACLMLARELALDPNHDLLRDLIIIIAPNYNADGNDRFDDVAKNRPGQVGPVQCGIRPNAQGLDLNRDYIKLEAPESRALVRFLTEADPHITIDCHTTNGSHHRYVLTYDAPLNPSGHAAPIHFIRNELLPAVTDRIKTRTGYDMWFYGNFNRERPPTVWETYSAQPRFGGPYQGLRNQMSILSEAYSYAPFKDRVIATREFLREILQYIAEHKEQVLEINRRARRETIEKGANPQPNDTVGIRHKVAAFPDKVLVKGYERASGGEGGAAADPTADLGPPKDHLVEHRGRFEPTLSVVRPFAYLIPPGHDAIIDKLQQHGISVHRFHGEATCEIYTITAIERSQREFQGHREVRIEAESRTEARTLAEGTHIVPLAQPLGTLAVYLLEAMSEDGLATWNFFDAQLEVGREFPVMRVRSPRDLRKPLPEPSHDTHGAIKLHPRGAE